MDKTLEIVMVAVALIIATVIVVGLLQGQVDMFGGFASDQTNSSGCGISKTQFCTAVDTSATSLNTDTRPYNIADENTGCAWASAGPGSIDPSAVCN